MGTVRWWGQPYATAAQVAELLVRAAELVLVEDADDVRVAELVLEILKVVEVEDQ